MNEQTPQPDVSIIIACYNEMPHLPESVREIEDVLDHTTYSYELIFIDDCSRDSTRDAIRQICQRKPQQNRYVFHEKNVGRGGTVREGFTLAQGSVAGFLDIDLEVRAWYIPVFVGYLRSGYDVVCAERIEQWSWNPYMMLRLVLSSGYRVISKIILQTRIPDSEAGYKFFNMSTMADLLQDTTDNGWFWDTEIMSVAERAGKKVQSVRTVFTRRPEKKSTVRLIPDTLAYLQALLRYRRQIRRDKHRNVAKKSSL